MEEDEEVVGGNHWFTYEESELVKDYDTENIASSGSKFVTAEAIEIHSDEEVTDQIQTNLIKEILQNKTAKIECQNKDKSVETAEAIEICSDEEVSVQTKTNLSQEINNSKKVKMGLQNKNKNSKRQTPVSAFVISEAIEIDSDEEVADQNESVTIDLEKDENLVPVEISSESDSDNNEPLVLPLDPIKTMGNSNLVILNLHSSQKEAVPPKMKNVKKVIKIRRRSGKFKNNCTKTKEIYMIVKQTIDESDNVKVYSKCTFCPAYSHDLVTHCVEQHPAEVNKFCDSIV